MCVMTAMMLSQSLTSHARCVCESALLQRERENACVHERDREFTMGESTSIPTWRNSVFIVVVIEASNVKYQLLTLRDKIKLMLHITKNCVSTLKHEKTQKL